MVITMKKYDEFNDLKIIEDKRNPFCTLYEYDDGSRFYIEPIFYSYLSNFKITHPNKIDLVLDKMEKLVRKNKKVIFSGLDEEYEDEPATKGAEEYIILTLFDILDMLGIYVENKSRGSDYGD